MYEIRIYNYGSLISINKFDDFEEAKKFYYENYYFDGQATRLFIDGVMLRTYEVTKLFGSYKSIYNRIKNGINKSNNLIKSGV